MYGMSEPTQWTIRVAVGFAALVAIVWLIMLAVNHQIERNHEVQKTCIAHGGSWIAGQCIQFPGGRS
jgi:hypothetical protein